VDFEDESAPELEYPSSGFSANWLSSRRILRVESPPVKKASVHFERELGLHLFSN
jgi:hypothetical protein